jgi:hypothetical protein
MEMFNEINGPTVLEMVIFRTLQRTILGESVGKR